MKKAMLAVKIERWIIKNKMTRQQFADFMGVQGSVVTIWLSGKHNFTLNTIERIETKLGLDLIKL